MDIDKLINMYVQLRDKKKEVQEQHKAELEPYNVGLMKLEARMQEALDAAGVKQMAGDHGTVFTKVDTRVSVDDWDTIVEYVKEHDAYDLLEKRVAKSAALERGDVPGLRTSQFKTVNVRRK